MSTTIGELERMEADLDGLLAAQQGRDAQAARAGVNADAESYKSWGDGLTQRILGNRPKTTNGRPESVASIRARKLAERAAGGGH